MSQDKQEVVKEPEVQKEMRESKSNFNTDKCNHKFDHHSCKLCMKKTRNLNTKPKIVIDITDRHTLEENDVKRANAGEEPA